MDMYDRIRNRRKELKMTQDELAKLTGYNDRSSIAKIEAKKADLSQSKIIAFASALKVSTSYLMDGEEPTKQADPIIEEYKLSLEEIVEFEKVMSINGALMFNGKEVSQEDKEELEQTLKRIFIRSLLLKRAKERDENGSKNS